MQLTRGDLFRQQAYIDGKWFHPESTRRVKNVNPADTRDEVVQAHTEAVTKAQPVLQPEVERKLLLLNDSMPCSVHRCLADLYENLRAVRNAQSAETERRAGELHAQLRFGRLEELCAEGVAVFLDRCQHRLNDLAAGIARDFLVPGA